MGKGKKGERGKNENGEKGKREKGKRRKRKKEKKGGKGQREKWKESNNKTLLTICKTIIDNNQSSVRHNRASVDRQC